MSLCPISHIPVSELRLPVVFRHKQHRVVFDAGHLVNWLRSYRLVDPVTNRPIEPDFAVNILMPLADDDATTLRFLSRAGYLAPQNNNAVPLEVKLKSDATIAFVYITLEYVSSSWIIGVLTFLAVSFEIHRHYPVNGLWILLIFFSGAAACSVSSPIADPFPKFQILLIVLSTTKVVLDLATGCGGAQIY